MTVDISTEGTAKLLNFAKELAIEGGKIIKEAFLKPSDSTYGRKSKTDPVTVTDEAVEKYICDTIKERYPDHVFIGEESASNVQWTDDPTWIIDPLDGTANCKSNDHRLIGMPDDNYFCSVQENTNGL